MAMNYNDNIFCKNSFKKPKTGRYVEVSKVPPLTLFMTENLNLSRGRYSNSSLDENVISPDRFTPNNIKEINQNHIALLDANKISHQNGAYTTECLLESHIVDNECTVLSQDNLNSIKQYSSQDMYIFEESNPLEKNKAVEVVISDDEIEECGKDNLACSDEISIIYERTKYNDEQQEYHEKIRNPLTNTRTWQGTLVWKKRLSNCSLALIHQVTCSVRSGDSLLEINPSSWSSTLTMQMFPHTLLKCINGNSFRGVIVDVELFPGEDFEILHYNLSSGLAGCIHVSNDQPSNDHLKAIILSLNRKTNKYIGFIPSEQDWFCNELKKCIVKYQQKFGILVCFGQS